MDSLGDIGLARLAEAGQSRQRCRGVIGGYPPGAGLRGDLVARDAPLLAVTGCQHPPKRRASTLSCQTLNELNDQVRSGPIGLHLRGTLRTSWRALVAIALLFGLTAGLSLAALASARRTSSAFDRLLQANTASDLSINYGKYEPAIDSALARLPGVASSATDVAFNAVALDDTGHIRTDITNDFETVGSVDGRFFDQDRVVAIDGRLPDPARVDEVAINESTARKGIAVGDELSLGMITQQQLDDSQDPYSLVPETREHVTVVGEIVFLDEVIQDDNDVIGRLIATPAFTRKNAEGFATYGWQGLRLEPGADPSRVSAAARALLLARDPEDPGFTLIRTVEEDRTRVERAVLPQVSALLIISLLVGVVALVLGLQAAVRQIRSGETDLSIYRSFGLGQRALTATAAAPVLLSIGLGALLAAVVALAASPLSPFGTLHRVEVDPGVHVDVAVIIGGVAALAAIAALGVVIAARSSARRTTLTGRSTRTRHISRLASWTQAAGAPVSVSVGAGYALQPQSGPQAAPVRTIAAGTTIAVAALVAALCFGSSLNRLVENPRLYGWNWDAAVLDQSGYGTIDLERAAKVLDADPAVEAWAPLGILSTSVDDLTVPVVAIRPEDRVGPAILTGRMVHSDHEIVLGRSTMRALHKNLGDVVAFGPRRVPLRIVGTATLPAIGQVHSSHPSPGEGAITLNSESFIAGPDAQAGNSAPLAEAPLVVIRFRPGSDTTGARRRLSRTTTVIGQFPGSAVFGDVARPAEIINARSTAIVPTLTSAMLTLAALISLSLALVAAVRRRRTDFASLKALGFTRRQVGAIILTQSLIVTTVGIVIGVPVGIIAGRWLWTRFAERMSVVNSPSVPITTVTVVILSLTVGALLVAIVPSQVAARVRPGDALREA